VVTNAMVASLYAPYAPRMRRSCAAHCETEVERDGAVVCAAPFLSIGRRIERRNGFGAYEMPLLRRDLRHCAAYAPHVRDTRPHQMSTTLIENRVVLFSFPNRQES